MKVIIKKLFKINGESKVVELTIKNGQMKGYINGVREDSYPTVDSYYVAYPKGINK